MRGTNRPSLRGQHVRTSTRRAFEPRRIDAIMTHPPSRTKCLNARATTHGTREGPILRLRASPSKRPSRLPVRVDARARPPRCDRASKGRVDTRAPARGSPWVAHRRSQKNRSQDQASPQISGRSAPSRRQKSASAQYSSSNTTEPVARCVCAPATSCARPMLSVESPESTPRIAHPRWRAHAALQRRRQ